MRLLNTGTLEFREFFDSQTPGYAILSHRWEGAEVSFQEFLDPKVRRSPRSAKIRRLCDFAKLLGFEWVWIDTCCIDKRSSAELTEAINSMYQWYQYSQICFAYLSDVVMDDPSNAAWESIHRLAFRNSAWFTRGWTLQELLAPRDVWFLDRNWRIMGSKVPMESMNASGRMRDLCQDISSATGIRESDIVDLCEPSNLEFISIARKMSWLSKRKTSRVEDMAYCMLGLCGVNMPLLYGEGQKAFTRLQLKIIKVLDDESIFAWEAPENFPKSLNKASGILAPLSACFESCANIILRRPMPGKKPFVITNKGLQYQVPRLLSRNSKLNQNYQHEKGDKYNLLLECSLDLVPSKAVSIMLFWDEGIWFRSDCGTIDFKEVEEWTNIVEQSCTYETLQISCKSRREVVKKHEQTTALGEILNGANLGKLFTSDSSGEEEPQPDVLAMRPRR